MDRRHFLMGTARTAGLFLLAGCDALSRDDRFVRLLERAENLAYRVHRRLTPRRALAVEYTEAERSPVFPTNGETRPDNPQYQAWAASGFANWSLQVTGKVARPTRFSLSGLRALPSRTQITRHDCVEGWSAIAKWKGVPLAEVLKPVGVRPDARFVVFHCADRDPSGVHYYESIDLEDAAHPQTILAYDLNDQPLPMGHGAPIRLRVERQLGYKMAKFVMRIELVDRLDRIGYGRGGYWEDQGYEWYAGI